MPLLRKLNQVLLVLLLLVLWLLLHATLQRASSQPKQGHKTSLFGPAHILPVGQSGDDNVIPVVICASEERMGATMATINSIISNTDTSVFFYVVTLRDAVKLIRRYIKRSKLSAIQYKILEFNPMVLRGKVKADSSRPELLHPLNFVRFYLPLLGISHKRVIYLDDDVIVQGDIRDLYDVKLKAGHAAAFATDCDLPSTHETVRSIGMQTTYMGFLDYRKQEVKDLGINPSDCSFNPGVFVADITEWTKQKVTKQLEKWMEENVRKNIYSSAMAGGVATPPMLIVFHDKYTTLDPLWHVRHLGKIILKYDTRTETSAFRIIYKKINETIIQHDRANYFPAELVSNMWGKSSRGEQMFVRMTAEEFLDRFLCAGWSPDARYSDGFLQEAHLLHWNGPFKPWNYPAVHLDLWERWFIPDPSGRFLLSRPERDS